MPRQEVYFQIHWKCAPCWQRNNNNLVNILTCKRTDSQSNQGAAVVVVLCFRMVVPNQGRLAPWCYHSSTQHSEALPATRLRILYHANRLRRGLNSASKATAQSIVPLLLNKSFSAKWTPEMFPACWPRSLEFCNPSNNRIIPLILNTNSCNRLTTGGHLHGCTGCSFPWPSQLTLHQAKHPIWMWLTQKNTQWC